MIRNNTQSIANIAAPAIVAVCVSIANFTKTMKHLFWRRLV